MSEFKTTLKVMIIEHSISSEELDNILANCILLLCRDIEKVRKVEIGACPPLANREIG